MANDAYVTLRGSILGFFSFFSLLGCSEHSPQIASQTAEASSQAGLKVHSVGPANATSVVFLLHGFGASGDDLLPLARTLSAKTPYRYAVVEAPLTRAEGGRAWWPIDFAAQRARFEQGRGLDLRNEDPAALPAARSQLLQLLDATRNAPGARVKQVAVVGFSQGAMLALDLALGSPRPPPCIGFLSGTFLRESAWRQQLRSAAKFEVFMSHGTEDTILPFALSQELHRALTDQNFQARFALFSGGHGIPPGVVTKLQSFLQQCLEP